MDQNLMPLSRICRGLPSKNWTLISGKFSKSDFDFRVQKAQIQTRTPQLASALRPCPCAVRPFVLTFTGSLDEELCWIQKKGRQNESNDLDHSHDVDDVDDLDEGIFAEFVIALPPVLSPVSQFTPL